MACAECRNNREQNKTPRKCDKCRTAQTRYRNSQKIANAEWRKRRRKAIIVLLGSKCIRCGFDDERALQVDHVNGGGTKERQALGEDGFCKKVLSDTSGLYQLLCANCNWIKRYENNECKSNLS